MWSGVQRFSVMPVQESLEDSEQNDIQERERDAWTPGRIK